MESPRADAVERVAATEGPSRIRAPLEGGGLSEARVRLEAVPDVEEMPGPVGDTP